MDAKRRIQSRSRYIRHVGRLAFFSTLCFAFFATHVDVNRFLGISKRSLDVLTTTATNLTGLQLPAVSITVVQTAPPSLNVTDVQTASALNVTDVHTTAVNATDNATNKSSPISQTKAHVATRGRLPLMIPLPVLVASLFKSGTTSLHSYFQCGRQRSVHYFGENQLRTGLCMLLNVSKRRDLLYNCGDYDIWTDNNAMDGCWDPSVYALDAFYNSFPSGTIILSTRDPDDWVNSVERWGGLMAHLKQCKHLWPQQPKRNLTTADIREFYLWQIDHVRQFAAAHPSLTYIEFALNDIDAGFLLEEKIGIPSSCWGQQNVFENTRFSKNNTDDREGGHNNTKENHERITLAVSA